jgi:hypothetical protein
MHMRPHLQKLNENEKKLHEGNASFEVGLWLLRSVGSCV